MTYFPDNKNRFYPRLSQKEIDELVYIFGVGGLNETRCFSILERPTTLSSEAKMILNITSKQPTIQDIKEIIIDSTSNKLTILFGDAPTDLNIAISLLLLFKPAIVIAIIPNRAIIIIKNVINLNALSTLPVNIQSLVKVTPGITELIASFL